MRTDAEIQKNVMEELKQESMVDASEIGVAVKDGVVTLSGTVNTYFKKAAAEKVAKKIAGVKAVAEDIEVKYTSDYIKNDTEIAKAILDALKWNSAINEEKIKVKVENGIVTMDGEVDWQFQKNAAQTQIETLIGVKGVINNVIIKPKAVTDDIKLKIRQSFYRNANINSDNINIETIGNKVILSGKVRSWAESEDAENAAWSAPGVTKVENNIKIEYETYV